MEVNEKIAYLKGLIEGLGIHSDTKEGKLMECIVDILDDLSVSVSDMEDGMDLMTEQIESMDEDLEEIITDLYDDEDDEAYDDDDYEEELYEVTCPKCGDVICVDEDMLDEGEITCPGCSETLEFDFSGALEDCNGDCHCGCDQHNSAKDKTE